MRLITILLHLPMALTGQSYVMKGDSPMQKEILDPEYLYLHGIWQGDFVILKWILPDEDLESPILFFRSLKY